jgi:eukaryotic-like serine/threonine-protein kinase
VEAGTELAGRYLLERILGSGGMGDVWQGTDQQLERPVAVKVMRDRLADPRRFRREGRIAARLQHPGITVVHDVGAHGGQPFIVMELLHGSDLAAMLSQAPGRRLPVETAVSLIVQAATALQAAHAAHVVHRDLKPANLFCQDNGLLKICDFGVARITDAVDGLTTAGNVIGTAYYMSPEQCAGETQIDGRSDLYSLGCVLYELLTGQPPFTRGQAREIMNQHMNASPASLRTLRPDIPGDLDTIVLTMLAKDPGDRPNDAGSLAAMLQATLRSGAPVGQSAPHRITTSARTAPAVDAESTVTTNRPEERRARKDTRAGARQPDRPLRTSPLPVDEESQLQVAPSTGSWSLLAFDPRGRWLASADGDGTITLWDVASGLPVRSWSAGAHVLAMTAGPGNRLAIGGDDGCARTWDVERTTLGDQFCGHVGGVHAVAFHPSGIRLATGDADGLVRLWEPGSRRPVMARRSAYGALTVLAFDASGGRLAAGGEDDTLGVWDVASPHTAILLAERPYGKEITAIAFGAAGQLAIGGADGQVWAWDLGSLMSRGRPAGQGHDGGVLALAWDAVEGLWVSVGIDGRLHAGDRGQQPVVAYGHVRAAAVSLATGRGAVIDDSSGRIHTFRIGDPGARQDLPGCDASLNGVAFGPSGGSVVTSGIDGFLYIWDARQQTVRPVGAPAYGISAVAGSAEGRLAAVCREDGMVTVYGIADGAADLTKRWAHQCPEPASAVAFSPDGSRVATAGDAVRVWQTKDGDAEDALPESGHLTRALAFDRTGSHLAATRADGAVLVWNATRSVLRHILVGHKGVAYAAAFSPLSRHLATAGSDGTVRIWDPDAGEQVLSLNGWECRARVLAFSPADGALALGCADGVVRFREPRNWTQTRAWPGHVHGITAMCFDVRGERLATAGRDGTVRVWDPATGTANLVLLPQPERWAAAVDGTVREHGDADGLIWFASGLSRQPPARTKLPSHAGVAMNKLRRCQREQHG